MKVVALISGGKDSCFNMMHVVAEGHEIVALANLYPSDSLVDELDSYMYQTVGHEAINLYSEAMDLPLYRRQITGSPRKLDMDYTPDDKDEVEDLYELLKDIKKALHYDAVASGAILSDYQRIRVESVCFRLGLTSLSYLWRRDQETLLQEMIDCELEAILIKTAALGLDPKKHLGKTLQNMKTTLFNLNQKYGCHVCGEGGEFETFTLDCPLFKKRIVIDESEIIIHSDDYFAPVGYLKLKKMHLEEKNLDTIPDLATLPILTSSKWERKYISGLEMDSLDSTKSILNDFQGKISWQNSKDDISNGTEVKTNSVGKFLTICDLVGRTRLNPDKEDVKATTFEALEKLKDIVTCHNHRLQDICYLQVNVAEMRHYKYINEVYSEFFTQNPPARACIGCLEKRSEANQETHVIFQINCISFRDPKLKRTMHVQGISHWAPANIGPFSQCVLVDDLLFVSGTIALVPGSMDLVEGGAGTQASLALRHVQSVVEAMAPNTSTKDFLQCVCYLTKTEDIRKAISSWSSARASEKQSELCEVLYVVVNELPKCAAAEWQGIVVSHSDTSNRTCDMGTMECTDSGTSIQLRWNFQKTTTMDNELYCCTCSIGMPKADATLDTTSCLKNILQKIENCLDLNQLTFSDVISTNLYYVGNKLSSNAMQRTWDHLPVNISRPQAISCMIVHHIAIRDGFQSCLSCVCLISSAVQ